jgi:hypothetical protein
MMNRLIMGQPKGEIARDMGITAARFSIIINSPLFKLELKRQLVRRTSRMLTIQDDILDAAEKGVKLHKTILEVGSGPGGEIFPIGLRMKAATEMVKAGVALMSTLNPKRELDGEAQLGTYEDHLKEVTREVTVKERVVTREGTPWDLNEEELKEESHANDPDPEIAALLAQEYPEGLDDLGMDEDTLLEGQAPETEGEETGEDIVELALQEKEIRTRGGLNG